MVIHYQWQTEGTNSCYSCKRWDKQVFSKLEDVPDLPVHPGCRCSIRAFETEVAAYQNTFNDLQKVRSAVAHETGQLQSFLLVRKLVNLFNSIKALLSDYNEYSNALVIFTENYVRMRNLNMIGVDKYFHAKANAEAAQLGKVGEETARFISDMREKIDYYKNLHLKKMSLEDSLRDIRADQQANEYGRKVGAAYPNEDIRPLIEFFKPRGMK